MQNIHNHVLSVLKISPIATKVSFEWLAKEAIQRNRNYNRIGLPENPSSKQTSNFEVKVSFIDVQNKTRIIGDVSI